ncbi:MAG: hypothetical protein AAGF47_06055 [Planctomycetota bacterium]
MQYQARVGGRDGSQADRRGDGRGARVTAERSVARRPQAVRARNDAALRVRRLERAIGLAQTPMDELTAMRTLELCMLLASLERSARAEGFSVEGTLFA